MKFLISILCLLSILSCQRKNIKNPTEAMRLSSKTLEFNDDLELKNLRWAIHKNKKFLLNEYKKKTLQFGPRVINTVDYAKSLEELLNVTRGKDYQFFKKYLKENFEVMEVYGGRDSSSDWSEVMITSYFEPVIKGSKYKTKKYSYPLYERPRDLVYIDLVSYLEGLPQLEKFKKFADDEDIDIRTLRGRIDKGTEIPRIVPYYSRKNIREQHSDMRKQATVLAWADPIEAFFLQIQGSGTVRFGRGKEMRIGYAGQNGHPYEAIGKYLLDVIPKEDMSLQAIETHLRTLSKEQMYEILDKNPSYVFFQILKSKPITYMGAEVIEGRTIATDFRLFPKGGLAFINFEKPIFEDSQSDAPVKWEPTSRFVVDQDTGGAIRGTGRVDLFWGRGAGAKQVAGVMKNPGQLFYLFPKNKEYTLIKD